MFNILLMIILLIIIFIFIILLFGIRIRVQWAKINSEIDGCAKILILKKVKVYTFDFNSDDDEDEEEDEEEDEDHPKRDIKKIYKLAKPCFKDIKLFLHKFFDAISINNLENQLVIGFSNFAKTGEYIGYIWAILAILNSTLPNTRLQAQPSFTGQTLKFKGSANIDISIIKLIKPIFDLLMKKEIRALINGVRNG